jgi:hypothetical protein
VRGKQHLFKPRTKAARWGSRASGRVARWSFSEARGHNEHLPYSILPFPSSLSCTGSCTEVSKSILSYLCPVLQSSLRFWLSLVLWQTRFVSVFLSLLISALRTDLCILGFGFRILQSSTASFRWHDLITIATSLFHLSDLVHAPSSWSFRSQQVRR